MKSEREKKTRGKLTNVLVRLPKRELALGLTNLIGVTHMLKIIRCVVSIFVIQYKLSPK